jgi:membrane-associated phospholipid phosphatase
LKGNVKLAGHDPNNFIFQQPTFLRIVSRLGAPSGHALHAVAFTTIASPSYPQHSWFLIPFTFLIALSRMVLGLHYPNDVLAGNCNRRPRRRYLSLSLKPTF